MFQSKYVKLISKSFIVSLFASLFLVVSTAHAMVAEPGAERQIKLIAGGKNIVVKLPGIVRRGDATTLRAGESDASSAPVTELGRLRVNDQDEIVLKIEGSAELLNSYDFALRTKSGDYVGVARSAPGELAWDAKTFGLKKGGEAWFYLRAKAK